MQAGGVLCWALWRRVKTIPCLTQFNAAALIPAYQRQTDVHPGYLSATGGVITFRVLCWCIRTHRCTRRHMLILTYSAPGCAEFDSRSETTSRSASASPSFVVLGCSPHQGGNWCSNLYRSRPNRLTSCAVETETITRFPSMIPPPDDVQQSFSRAAVVVNTPQR